MLDPRVEDVLHVLPPRVGDDRAVAERTWPELHPPLEPADDVAGGDPLGHVDEELAVVEPAGVEPRDRQRARALFVRVGGSRGGVLHHEPARMAELLVPDVVGGADGDARVAGRRLDEHLLERRLRPDPPVRDRVQRDAAREADPRDSRALPQSPDEVEVDLLEHRLERRGDVLVQRVSSDAGSRAGPKSSSMPRREEPADRRRPLVPAHVHAFLVVDEEVEVELEDVALRTHDPPHLVEKARRAVRREAHHLALVAVLREAEPLGDRGVEDPERVREQDALEHAERGSAALREHRRGEVAEAVDGQDRGVLERRDEERARDVRLVVLDVVELGAHLGSERRLRARP